jgi:hypothetical protein
MQTDSKKLAAWLKLKGVKPTCPACGKKKWTLSDTVTVPTFDGSNAVLGINLPAVPLICANCAFVRFFAAVPANLHLK